MAQKGERLANKELVQITFDNDEFEEKFKYLEQKYHALIERMGASQEDIDFIDEKIMIKNESRANNGKGGRRRGTVQSYGARKSRVSGAGANKRPGVNQARGNT